MIVGGAKTTLNALGWVNSLSSCDGVTSCCFRAPQSVRRVISVSTIPSHMMDAWAIVGIRPCCHVGCYEPGAAHFISRTVRQTSSVLWIDHALLVTTRPTTGQPLMVRQRRIRVAHRRLVQKNVPPAMRTRRVRIRRGRHDAAVGIRHRMTPSTGTICTGWPTTGRCTISLTTTSVRG